MFLILKERKNERKKENKERKNNEMKYSKLKVTTQLLSFYNDNVIMKLYVNLYRFGQYIAENQIKKTKIMKETTNKRPEYM